MLSIIYHAQSRVGMGKPSCHLGMKEWVGKMVGDRSVYTDV